MMRVVIVGAGGHGHVVADILQAMKAHHCQLEPIGFVDDDRVLHGTAILGLPILGSVGDLAGINHDAIVVAIGDNPRRRQITEHLIRDGEHLISAVHPSAVVAPSAQIGQGSMICAGAVIGPATTVGLGAIINTSSSVDHHNNIADYVHVGPGARLGGEVSVGAGTLVGLGALLLPRITVGERATIAAGAVVTRDVPGGALMVGVPAKRINRETHS